MAYTIRLCGITSFFLTRSRKSLSKRIYKSKSASSRGAFFICERNRKARPKHEFSDKNLNLPKPATLSDFKKVVSSSGVNFIFRIAGLAFSFGTTIIITRLFGVDIFGNYSIAFTVSQATAIVFTLGIPNTMIKLIGNHNFNYNQAKQLLIKGLKAAALLSLVPASVFYFGSEYLAVSVFHNARLEHYFLAVTVSLPLFVMHEILLYFLIATKSFIKYNLFMFVVPNVLLIGFLLLSFYLHQPEYFAFIAFCASIFVTVIAESIVIFERNPPKESMPYRTMQLLKIASPLMFSGLMLYLLNWTNIIMLGILVDESDVGVYNIAYKIGSVGFLIIISVSTIITPRMAELYGQKNIPELRKLIHNSTRLIAVLTIPVVAVLVVLGKFLLSFFGEEAVAGYDTLSVIAIGVLFSAVAGNVDQILNMTNNQKIFRNITISCFFVNVALNYFLIVGYGIFGAAMASLVTNVLINLVSLYYIKKKLGFFTLA